MTTRPTCPTRCFLADLPRHIPSKRLFRLLGSVVGIHQDVSLSQLAHISMDDGTSMVSVVALHAMILQIHLTIGHTVECIVRLEHDHVGSQQILFVDQLVRVDDPHAETLRWLELARQRQDHAKDDDDNDMEFGFPHRFITANDIFDIISAEGMVGNKDGVKLEDLALVLDMPDKMVAEMVEDLQLSGQIYRNESGGYLPL